MDSPFQGGGVWRYNTCKVAGGLWNRLLKRVFRKVYKNSYLALGDLLKLCLRAEKKYRRGEI
jgi:hypothetical protein